jgi:hypothetical protein
MDRAESSQDLPVEELENTAQAEPDAGMDVDAPPPSTSSSTRTRRPVARFINDPTSKPNAVSRAASAPEVQTTQGGARTQSA